MFWESKFFTVGGSRGWANRGSGSPPPEKSQKYSFASNTGPDPLKYHKATKTAINVGSSSVPSESPFEWRFAGERMTARFLWNLDTLFPNSLINLKHTKRRKKEKNGPPLVKVSGSLQVYTNNKYDYLTYWFCEASFNLIILRVFQLDNHLVEKVIELAPLITLLLLRYATCFFVSVLMALHLTTSGWLGVYNSPFQKAHLL